MKKLEDLQKEQIHEILKAMNDEERRHAGVIFTLEEKYDLQPYSLLRMSAEVSLEALDTMERMAEGVADADEEDGEAGDPGEAAGAE